MCNLSSLTRDQTHVPCVGRRILNHWTTREVSQNTDFNSYLFPQLERTKDILRYKTLKMYIGIEILLYWSARYGREMLLCVANSFCFFLAGLHGLWDPRSLTRDRTWGPQQWKCGVLTTGLPGNSLCCQFLSPSVKISKPMEDNNEGMSYPTSQN